MSEMRRLWVDRSIYDNHSALITWLTDQGLSRFFVEVGQDEDKVIIDVHPLPENPLSMVHRSDPLASANRCDDLDCPLCVTVARPSGAIPAYSTDEFRKLPDVRLTPLAEVVAYPSESIALEDDTNPKWGKPLRIEDDTDPIPRLRANRLVPYPPAFIWTGSILLAMLAAFICVRLWYVKYGCPFWPDGNLLGACKALTIQVGK